MGQLVGGGGHSPLLFISLRHEYTGTSMAISMGQTPLVVQLASLVGWVKFPNWLIWVTNVSQGSLIVSIGHIGVYLQYRDK